MNTKIARTLSAILFLALLVAFPRVERTTATVAPSEDRVALYQALLDLQNPWTVMCVAAHPDDEDGTSLIVMRHKYGAHTVSLFSTFGEGGQNAIGPELYEELGAIRARETMAAAEIQGSEPHFLGLKDFGFSKSRDEAFKFWGHEEALRRMVLQIRKLRPDVIITNHSTTSNDHGHHQATALMVVEAFDAAADSTKFPEQLKDGVTTWQVQRLFVRQRGNQAQQNPDRQGGGTQIVTIDPNEQDPVRGTVFGEQALNALQKHATQGPWPKSFAEYTARFRAFSGQNAPAGQLPMIRYGLVKSAGSAAPMPAGESHNFLDGLALTETEASEVAAPTINGRALTDFLDQRPQLIDALDTRWQATQRFLGATPRAVPQNKFRMSWFVQRINIALAAASGVKASLVGPDVLVPSTSAAFKLVISNAGVAPITVAKHNLATGGPNLIGLSCCPTLSSDVAVMPGHSIEIPLNHSVANDTQITVPHSANLYSDRVFGIPVSTSVQVKTKSWFWIGATKSIDVAPPVEIAAINPLPVVIHDEVGASSAGADIIPGRFPQVSIELINHLDQPFKGEVVYGRARGTEQISKVEIPPHQNTTIALSISNSQNSVAAHARSSESPETLTIAVRTADSRANITERSVPIVRANAHVVRNLNVGYIRGFDFSLPNALNSLGVESKELSVDDVKTADLSKFTSVIVDNRVYESKPELIAVNQKLLDYAQAGGNLIVFYHKSDEWNPDERRNRPQLAPYKLILGGERITDENAPITFIEPDHPLLNTPNKLGQDDFKDWIQERGLYYPKEWDPQFHALLQSNDPGENPLKGGLLVADYGKGHYIYTSMVWYRELRGGIPGAYRMLANMISYGRN
ncbi:MAG TPA: PIG-L family deacetylase [Pyrinomonadaceae bacterium]|nr:PIG-L family deacetylase [Pyrinomonadaceae bacterium]